MVSVRLEGLQGEPALSRWTVGALREGCSSPAALLLLLSALHEGLLTAQPLLEAGVYEDYEDTQCSVKEEISLRLCRKAA